MNARILAKLIGAMSGDELFVQSFGGWEESRAGLSGPDRDLIAACARMMLSGTDTHAAKFAAMVAAAVAALDAGANPRADCNYPLHVACLHGCLEVAERLFAAGLTAEDARSGDNDALRIACERGYLGIVELLFARNPATPAFQGLTADDARAGDNAPLRRACANGHLGVVSRLFEAGLTADDARARDNEALRRACANGHLAVVSRLFEAGLTAEDAAAWEAAKKAEETLERALVGGLRLAD